MQLTLSISVVVGCSGALISLGNGLRLPRSLAHARRSTMRIRFPVSVPGGKGSRRPEQKATTGIVARSFIANRCREAGLAPFRRAHRNSQTVRGFASRAPGALHLPGFLEIIPDRRQLGRTLAFTTARRNFRMPYLVGHRRAINRQGRRAWASFLPSEMPSLCASTETCLSGLGLRLCWRSLRSLLRSWQA